MKRAGWLAALFLLVLVNAVVLAGVAWNRSGESDVTVLTERELRLPYVSSRSEENTGLALRLELHQDSYAPGWLNANKLRQLGFTIPDAGSAAVDSDEWRKRPLPRRAWAVLEFDGPAWQAALADERRELAGLRLELETGKVTLKQIKAREKALTRREQSGSRLVAVDAGMDAAALRALYPDAARYVIVGARVRVWMANSQSPEDMVDTLSVKGYLRVLVDRLHVPLHHGVVLQGVLDGDLSGERGKDAEQSPRYAVRLSYGRRHEPWVQEIVAIE